MSTILCIESGTAVCSVGLSVDGELVSLRESDATRNHASELALFIDEVLEENDLRGSDLDAVAVGQGPGSYTGLRIGAATAKGMAYALSIPLIAVDSLQALSVLALQEYNAGILAVEDPEKAILAPMIDARRMEVYTALYDLKLDKLGDTRALIIDAGSFGEFAGREVIMFGDGARKAYDLLTSEAYSGAGSGAGPLFRWVDIASSARGMCGLAENKFEAQNFADLAYWEPHYLKDFVVTTSKKTLSSTCKCNF